MKPSIRYRARAIFYALWFSVRPSWMYEDKCHHEWSYLQHLYVNVCYACRWATFAETESDRAFEKKANG